MAESSENRKNRKSFFTTVQTAYMAMFAGLVLLGTFVIRIPTPVYGFVHVGDGFVLLSGMILGPLPGALAAAIGSGLADLLGGYPVWVPGTAGIKFLTALTAASVYRMVRSQGKRTAHKVYLPAAVISGILGEAVMVIGYFFYDALLLILISNGETQASFASAAALSAAEIPFNLVQAGIGVAASGILLPLFSRLFRKKQS